MTVLCNRPLCLVPGILSPLKEALSPAQPRPPGVHILSEFPCPGRFLSMEPICPPCVASLTKRCVLKVRLRCGERRSLSLVLTE